MAAKNILVERRKYPRVSMLVLLDLYVDGEINARGRGVITDLSLGGMALETKENFDVGETLVLRFKVVEGVNFAMEGEVVRKDKKLSTTGYGVKFFNIGFKQKIKLRNFILARVT